MVTVFPRDDLDQWELLLEAGAILDAKEIPQEGRFIHHNGRTYKQVKDKWVEVEDAS